MLTYIYFYDIYRISTYQIMFIDFPQNLWKFGEEYNISNIEIYKEPSKTREPSKLLFS